MQGFYLENKEYKESLDEENLKLYTDFIFLENLDVEETNFNDDNIDAFQFLHGNCDYFAIELSKRFGYEIVVHYTHDYLIHAYCKKGDYFIDVRGVTKNEESFWNEFKEDIEDDSITKDEQRFCCYNDFIKFVNDLNYGFEDLELPKLSRTIINNYEKYYKIQV